MPQRSLRSGSEQAAQVSWLQHHAKVDDEHPDREGDACRKHGDVERDDPEGDPQLHYSGREPGARHKEQDAEQQVPAR